MKENVKLGVLAAVALLTLVNTYQIFSMKNEPVAMAKPSSSVAAGTSTTTPTANNTTTTVAEPVQQANIATTTFNFSETEHSFGKINQDTENRKVFTFTNTGNEPLIIENAKGSCGCTVPNYPKEPIAPGKTGEIEVIYKPGKQKGNQSKTVTITANTDPKNTMLYITADVQEVK